MNAPAPITVAGPALNGAFKADHVDHWDGFEALRPEWEALERRDPEGHVFLSWRWLARAFRANPGRWRVLTVRRSGALVAVLPLKLRVHWSADRSEFQTEIEAGGKLLWSEYTGFLCDPAHEAPALASLARRVQEMPWVRLSMRYEDSARRAALFTHAFSRDAFEVRNLDYRINRGETDNLSCPRVSLPSDYETYLATRLGKNTRRNFRRFMERRIDGGDLTVTLADSDTLERDVDILLSIWRKRWDWQKGPDLSARVAASYASVMHAAHAVGLLHLPVLWRDGAPLGALGHVRDPLRRRMHCVVSCRDGEAGERNVGFMLHAHSIRWAIRQGYGVYDFSHGDEAYKFEFGAEANKVNYFAIRRRVGGTGGSLLDPMNQAEAMTRVIRFIEAGKAQDAAAGCRQFLKLMR